MLPSFVHQCFFPQVSLRFFISFMRVNCSAHLTLPFWLFWNMMKGSDYEAPPVIFSSLLFLPYPSLYLLYGGPVGIRTGPDQLWDPPSLLSDEYGEIFPPGVSGRGFKLNNHPHIVLRSGMVELYLHSPIRLHSIVLN
jgi:hypothetical protein